MSFKFIIIFIGFFVAQNIWAEQNICSKDEMNIFQNISQYIDENPQISEVINVEKIETISTNENEFKKLVVEKPTRVEFIIYPRSEVTILKLPTEKCGVEIAISGKVSSSGEHLYENSCVEMQTEEVEIVPEGTSYLAETGALNNALAEMNDDYGIETGSIKTYEKFTVQKGSIQIRLKKIYKGVRVKQTRISKNKFRKTKTQSKMFAYNNEKIKLKSGVSLKIKKSRKIKQQKQQVAELEIITPG